MTERMSLPFTQPISVWAEAVPARRSGAGRRLLIAGVASAVTASWALILYAASWAASIDFKPVWFIPVLLAIFVLLVLGLNMASMASQTMDADDGNLPPAA